jgi:lipopolysaccharide export system permease protein
MILPAYFIRETLKLTVAIVGGLTLVYLSMRFANALAEAAEGKVAPQHIARIVSLKMLVSLKDLLPMALFLATYAAIVRLQQGSEWVAMRAAGLSHARLLWPLLAVSLAAALVVGSITLVIGPQAERSLRELEELTENEATIAGVRAGRFREMAGGKRIFYAERIAPDERHLERPFVYSAGDNTSGVLRADRAAIETDSRSRDRFAVFERGASYSAAAGEASLVATEFARYGVRIENRETTEFGAHIGFLLTSELLRLEGAYYDIELQWRLALPISALLAPALALLIGLGARRGHWYLGLLTAVAAYFAYINVLGVGRALMHKGVLSTALGLWPVHLTVVAILLGLVAAHRRIVRLPRTRQELLRA